MPGREEFWNIGYPLWGMLVYTLLIRHAGGVWLGHLATRPNLAPG